MTETRTAAGLIWTRDSDNWTAEDGSGTYKLVEWAPGQWMDFWWRHEEACGCGSPAQGGRDWPDFDQAARAIVELAREEVGP